MKIKEWNKNYQEDNHVSNNPNVLLNHLKELTLNNGEILITDLEIEVKNEDYANSLIVEIEGYWLKKKEYDILIDKLNKSSLNLKKYNTLKITYNNGLVVKEVEILKEYYLGYYFFTKSKFNVNDQAIVEYIELLKELIICGAIKNFNFQVITNPLKKQGYTINFTIIHTQPFLQKNEVEFHYAYINSKGEKIRKKERLLTLKEWSDE